MSAGGMTRRSLLAATAGAVATGAARRGGVLRPIAALGALGAPPRPTLQECALGPISRAPTTVTLARVADLLGVQWHGPATAHIELRFRLGRGRGRWSEWVSAGSHGHGPEAPDVGEQQIGDPVWTGGAREIQLRANETLDGVRLQLVDVSGGVGARRLASARGAALASSAALPLAGPVLNAGPGQPPIIARHAWAQGMAPPPIAPGYGSVRMAFVHHTESPNGYLAGEVPPMLRAIYVYHRYVRGWNDIGYNFVLDLYGRIFEARAGGIDESVVGAQAGGFNIVSSGVAVLGDFSSVPISAAARAALERLLAWKLSLHGVPARGRVTVRVNPAGASYSRFPAGARVSLPRIAGHRDGDATECPGNVLYGELSGIRAGAHSLAPQPTRASLALSPATATVPATLDGSVELLDGTPIAGAPVALQARTVSSRGEAVLERTLGEAVTDAAGQWSFPAAFSSVRGGAIWLRALYAGSGASGAAVSQALRVPVAPASDAPTEPEPTPPAAAPAAP